MARRRSYRPWWHSYRDEGRYNDAPFDFIHAGYLLELGLAQQLGDELVLDAAGLAVYTPPSQSSDNLALDLTGGIVRRHPTGTRIDPVAAQWLWDHREDAERDGLVTFWAWCTRCGKSFEDGRAGTGLYVAPVRRYCDACANTRSRHLPNARQCAADDCGRWFRPARKNHLYCNNAACREAARRAAA